MITAVARDHTAIVSREELADLWRVDCPACGPVAIGQGYRADGVAIAARHREANASDASLPGWMGSRMNLPGTRSRDTPVALAGLAHLERSQTFRRSPDRRDRDTFPAL